MFSAESQIALSEETALSKSILSISIGIVRLFVKAIKAVEPIEIYNTNKKATINSIVLLMVSLK